MAYRSDSLVVAEANEASVLSLSQVGRSMTPCIGSLCLSCGMDTLGESSVSEDAEQPVIVKENVKVYVSTLRKGLCFFRGQ